MQKRDRTDLKLRFGEVEKMYKATNIDTDKALEAIKRERALQERESRLRAEKERSFMEGLNKGLDIAEGLFDCSNYEKAEEATYADGVREVFCRLGMEFDVLTQDIRDNISPIDKACALFADRVREKISAIANEQNQKN